MWHSLTYVGFSYGEKAIRTILVYLVIVVLLRLAGQRELAQLNNFDLVVMLLLSNVVQNAIIGPDNSVTGGAVGAAVLVMANAALVRAAVRFPWLGRVLQSPAVVVARDGRYERRTIQRLGLRWTDLDVAVRRQGGDTVDEAERITLAQGALLVQLREADQSADKADVHALARTLERIEGRLTALEQRRSG